MKTPILMLLALTLSLGPLSAQPADRPNDIANPAANHYAAVPGFLKLPPGRVMGSSSAVAGDSRGHIWVVDRCGANDCAGSQLNPVMEFDAHGTLLRSWGAGQFLFPHGFFIDAHDHLWITDGHADKTRGFSVQEFTPDGTLVRALDVPGHFYEPNAVLVTDKFIFVAQNHTRDFQGKPRVFKFDLDGKLLAQWGESGHGPGQFGMPHCLALDREGRLYVGDRDNNRIEIFTQDGKYLGQLHQFSRPSGCLVDANDRLYVTDSESKTAQGYGHNPGYRRGIRIGSIKTGIVEDFIPDTYADVEGSSTSGGEGLWADGKGAVYSAQVQQKAVVKYQRN